MKRRVTQYLEVNADECRALLCALETASWFEVCVGREDLQELYWVLFEKLNRMRFFSLEDLARIDNT